MLLGSSKAAAIVTITPCSSLCSAHLLPGAGSRVGAKGSFCPAWVGISPLRHVKAAQI